MGSVSKELKYIKRYDVIKENGGVEYLIKVFDAKTRTALLKTIENIKNNAVQATA